MTQQRLDIEHARAVAIDAVEAAGDLLRSRLLGAFDVQRKDAAGDLVTDLDFASENLIIGRLRAEFPGHRIVAEESGELPGDHRWSWIVDPLDGTNNVAIGLADYCVGVALAEYGRPVLGVIHEPASAATWWAQEGVGAYGPAGRLPRPRTGLPGTLPTLAWVQGHPVGREDVRATALKLSLERSAKRLLQLWAPLLGWVMLARGDIDGVIGYEAGAVDLYAGALLAKEAGVTLRELDGGPFDDHVGTMDRTRSFIAARTEVLGRLVRVVDDGTALQEHVGRILRYGAGRKLV
ncbi:MAG: inositol monophosphatase [Streptosporangiales bacterium]|nr:inositol monophosphatase [Streptosporangiales bacterium]